MSSSIQPKPVRVFSKEQPCTKVELFNCFWDKARKDWRPRAVIEARGEIGDNAPKYLLSKGYARAFQRQFVDWYELSESGREWLMDGLMAYLKRHPDKWNEVSDKAALMVRGIINPAVAGQQLAMQAIVSGAAKRLNRKR